MIVFKTFQKIWIKIEKTTLRGFDTITEIRYELKKNFHFNLNNNIEVIFWYIILIMYA